MAAQLGSRELIVGPLGLPVIVKFTALEVPPPGAGLVAVTVALPTEAMAAAGMAAVNCVALTKVALGAMPLKLTVEAATKFAPLIVRVKAAPPAMMLFGEIDVIVGVGLELTDWPALPPQPRANRAVTLARATMAFLMVTTSGR